MRARPGFDGRIEIVRGQMSEARSDQLLRFWSGQGVLEGPEARRRLAEVVCVLVDEAGETAGVNSVYPQKIALIGGRLFWTYRSLLLPTAANAWQGMIDAAFTALEEEFEPTDSGPIGLCLLVDDPALMARHPEAIWPETELMFAGYLPGGEQVRIRYFYGAAIGPGLPSSPALGEMRDRDIGLNDRYRIEPFDQTDAASPDDVLALWDREAAVPAAEARRRVHEVHLVAMERTEGMVGVSSAYLQRNPQLGMDLWHYRAFVARAHRNSNLAVALALQGRDLLKQRFVSGEDTRGRGIIFEVEHEGLKTYFNKALWLPTEFTFIGENRRGDHVRVHYFPGAVVPTPRGTNAPG